jgi:16S rRNA (cytosine1402-N4)-methyltransferase
MPVMLDEALELLAPRSGGLYCDGTTGQAGHSRALLEATAPAGRLLALDRDGAAVEVVRSALASYEDRATVVQARFGDLPEVLDRSGLGRLDGLLLDLGISSVQLGDRARGLSFAQEGPLDMRLDPSQGETAGELIDRLNEQELANVIFQLGEERRSRAVARAIKRAAEAGELETTLDLARVVRRAVGSQRSGRIDASTRTFQALRMAVNDELGELSRLLDVLPDLLQSGGRAVFISFHSLEDRAVKRALRSWSSCRCDRRRPRCTCGGPILRLVTGGKPLRPSQAEVEENPRARSARLRAAERLPRTEAA